MIGVRVLSNANDGFCLVDVTSGETAPVHFLIDSGEFAIRAILSVEMSFYSFSFFLFFFLF